MPTASYFVTGMTCEHCVHAVTEEVSAVPGVSDVAVDLDSGRLTVVSRDEDTSQTQGGAQCLTA